MAAQEPTPQIELQVSNFGPIAEAKIDLRPLTVFVGQSNTGKSYLAILLYALQVALASNLDPRHRVTRIIELESERIHIDQESGDKASPSSVEHAISWLEELEDDSADVALAFSDPVRNALAKSVRKAIEVDEETGHAFVKQLGRCFGVGESLERLVRAKGFASATASLRISEAEGFSNGDYLQYALTFGEGNVKFETSLSDSFPVLEPSPANLGLLMATQFLRMRLNRAGKEEHEEIAQTLIDELAAAAIGQSVAILGRPIYYLPADRSGVMHAHSVVISALVDQAVDGGLKRQRDLPLLSGVLADFLRELISMGESPERQSELTRGFALRLESDLLGGAVQYERGESRAPLIEFLQDGRNSSIPLMRASSMVSEMAPVVLYLRHLVDPDETLIIEEPESHLHPDAQAEFACHLARLVNSGIRVVVTTHSNWIVDQVANLVRMSELHPGNRFDLPGHDAALAPQDVGVWLFEETSEGNGSTVKEINFDPDGVGYEPGYFGIADKQYNTWAEINNRLADAGRRV